MKKIVLAVFALIIVSVSSKAQIYTKVSGYGYQWTRGFFDSTLHIPIGSTPLIRSNITKPGALFYNTTDSSLYTWTGVQWVKAGGGGTITNIATNNATGIIGGPITTTGTISADTLLLSTRKWRQKGIDSLQENINGKLNISDTATMLAPYLRKADTTSMLSPYFRTAGVGLASTGQTVYADTLLLSTRAWRQKGVDSLQANINGKLNISDTSSMLQNYVNSVGYGLGKSGQSVSADSATLSAYYLRRKDSLTATNSLGYVTKTILADTAAAIRGADAGGTVTSVATNNGTGITGGTITTTGTISADTLLLSTRAWRQKGIDSVAALANSKINGSLLSGYLTKATGSLTIDTSQIYQSSGLVGIGTTSPTEKLDVRGKIAVNTSGQSFTINNYYPSGGQGNNIFIGNGGQNGVYTGGLFNAAWNTSLGINAFLSSTTGFQNTAIGYRSLETSTTGNNNVAVGATSMLFTTSGTQNVAVGTFALATNTTGQNNTAVGQEAGANKVGGDGKNQTSTNSVYLGYQTKSSADGNTNEIVIGSQTDGNGSNSVTLGNTSVTKTILRSNVGIGTTAPDSALTVVNGAYFQRGVRMSGLPTAPGTKALRINANGTLSIADTLVDAGGTVTSVATNNGTGITGGTITTTGTLAIDTLLISTRAWRQKGIDSVVSLIPSLAGYVPYTGATQNVNLGVYDLTADVITGSTGSFSSSGSGNNFGITHSSGSGIALNITKGGNGEGLYVNKTSGTGNAATIVGTLEATTLVKSGGTSSQYLMADGSTSTLTNPVTGTGTTNYIPKFTGSNSIGNSNLQTDASGNLGLGVTPSAWNSTFKALQISNRLALAGSANETLLGNNWYQNNTPANIYLETAAATLYRQASGEHQWYTAPSGTAGNTISFTQAMTLFNTGNLAVGGTSDGGERLQVTGTVMVKGVSYPSIAFDSDASSTTWSLYSASSNDYFGLYNGTTDVLVAKPNGNVGIGTTNPGCKLHIAGDGNATNLIRLQHTGTGGNGYFDINVRSTEAQLVANYSTTAIPMLFLTGATERMRITSGGNVLVGGTSDNGSRLNVTGAGTFSSSVTAQQGIFRNSGVPAIQVIRDLNVVSVGAAGQGIEFGALNGTTPTASAAIYGVLNNPATTGLLVFQTLTGGSLTTKMTITDAGNVGIGTTSPNYKLDVRGASSSDGFAIFSGGSGLTKGGIYLGNEGTQYGSLWFDNANNNVVLSQNYVNGNLTFGTNSTERMRITSGGEVLVNTTTDAGAYYLQVNGDVYAGAYYESSDRRLKDILSVRGGSDGINTVTFKWKDQRDSLSHVGYIAQDVEKVLPDAVKTNPDGYKTVNYDEVQTFKIAALEKEIAELKEMLKKIIDKK